jgi:transforming growth factor-beta-induced protein
MSQDRLFAEAAPTGTPLSDSAQEELGYASVAAAEGDIVETAAAAGAFTTLGRAIEAAGLTETLKGEGPFTVFAPTNEAFAKLPKGTLDALLEDREKLAAVLTYHVVPRPVGSADIARLTSVRTANGKVVPISTADGKVMVGNATLIQTNIPATNGVIHVIDTVLLPA